MGFQNQQVHSGQQAGKADRNNRGVSGDHKRLRFPLLQDAADRIPQNERSRRFALKSMTSWDSLHGL